MKHPLRVLTVSSAAATLLAGLSIVAPAVAAARTGPLAILHVGQIDQQDVATGAGCEPDTLVEPDIEISPFNSQIEVAVAHDCRFSDGGAQDISYAWTHNGGATWHHAPVPKLTQAVGGAWVRASDPVVAFGSDGSVYISSLVFNLGCLGGVAVSKSADGGATFAAPVVVHQSCKVGDDKNWLVTDDQPQSPFFGRVYQFWSEFMSNGASPQVVSWSDDQGQHWTAPRLVTSVKGFDQDSQPFVQPDGAITDTYINSGSAFGDDVHGGPIIRHTAAGSGTSIVAQTSFDGGATWTKPAVIGRNVGGGPDDIRCCLPVANGDAATGHMYAVWNSAGSGNLDPVMLSSSADGRTWTTPVRISPGGNPNVEFLNPAVAASKGRVFVTYGSRNLATHGGNLVRQNLTWSANGGATWSQPIALGPPSNLKYAAISRAAFPGDYTGLSATPNRVSAAWCVSSKPPNPAAAFHQVLYAAVLSP